MLIVIIGSMGSGKTLLATDMALTSKVPVLSNYKIKSKNVHALVISQLLHLPYKKCKVILDEAYAYLESRLSMSKLNLYMSYILFQSRKRGIDIIITAQLESSIDNRFVQLANIRIYAQVVKDGFRYFITNGKSIKLMKITFKNAEKIWGLYDTNEVVMPPNIEGLETTIEVMDRKVLKKKIDELEKEIRDEFGDIKYTHAIVSSFLLDHDYSEIFEMNLYARLQKPIRGKQ